MICYEVYIMSAREKVVAFAKGMLLISLVGCLFYSSVLSVVCMCPFLLVYIKNEKRRLCRKRKEQLRCQFKDGIQALLAALDSGYSVENAFVEANKDLAMIYPEGSYITEEFRRIVHGITMNKTVEEMLEDFAVRSGLDEIQSFVEVFNIARRSGGDLLMIIRSSAGTIREEIEVKQEIDTLMAGKRLEQKVMNMVPFGILAYVRMTSGGFLDILYGNVLGVAIMSGCLAVYIVAWKLADRIVDVEV